MNRELASGVLISLFFHLFVIIVLPGLPEPKQRKPDYVEVDVYEWKEIISSRKRDEKSVIHEAKEERKAKVKQMAVKKAMEEPELEPKEIVSGKVKQKAVKKALEEPEVQLKQTATEKVKPLNVEKVKTDVEEKTAREPVKRSFVHLQPFYKKAEVFGTRRVVKSFVETELPELKVTDAEQIKIEKKPLLPKQEIIEELSGKAKDIDKGTPLIEDTVQQEKKAPTEMFDMEKMDKKKLIEKEIARKIEDEESRSAFQIRGPVSKRRQVVYKPSLPKTTGAEGEIELKFWVLPDGTVGRIVPVKRGDPLLEEEAIRYLKKWRFNPLKKAEGEEWGIIPIKFVLK